MLKPVRRLSMLLRSSVLLGLATHTLTDARSLCTSDGQTAPSVLMERFINADCADCWRAPDRVESTDRPDSVALDWIAPGPLEDQGALSAAARLDTLARLRSLGRELPPRSAQRTQIVAVDHAVAPAPLRVAHGRPVGDYLGTSIEWRNAPPGRWRAWLVMVEELPAGTAGSPVARRLVRNSLQLEWTVPGNGVAGAPAVWSELRPMQIPPGAQADRLAVVGFVESAESTAAGAPRALAALASSRCDMPP